MSPSPGLAVHSGTKHMVEAVADAVRQEVSHKPTTKTKTTLSAQVKGSGVKVGVVRPGGIATPGYDHAAGSIQSRCGCGESVMGSNREAAASLGCWVPADTSGCLQPDVVAAQVDKT